MTEPQSLDAGTEYVILAKADDVSVGWVPVAGTVVARSPSAAVRAGAQNSGRQEGAGDFKAIPLRSWKTTYTVTPKTETKLVIEESE